MAAKTIDHEVVQRLAKAFDLVALTGITLFLTLQASHTQYQVAVAGFFALFIAFAVLRLIRGFDLYDVNAWFHGATTAAKGFAIAAFIALGAWWLSPLFDLPLGQDWVTGFITFAAIYFALSRLFTHVWSKPLAHAGGLKQRIAIVGGGKAAEDAINLIELSPHIDCEVVGLFDDRFDNRSPESIRKHRKLGKITDLADFARSNRVDLVIVAIPMTAEQRLLQILKRLWVLPVDIRISAAAAELKLSPRAYTYLGKLPLLNVFERPLSGWDSFLKSVMDKTIALLAIVALPVSAESRVLQLIKKLWVLPVDIRLAAHASKLRFRPRAYSYAGNVPLIDVVDKPIADWDKVMKWVFDKVVGTLALIALSPVMVAVAIAIKLDSKGPVFFRQKRFGFNNELVEVFKFRSMYTDMSDAQAAKLVTKDDPRVTRGSPLVTSFAASASLMS